MKKFTFVFLGLITLVACEAELETENANSFGEANGLTRSGLTISPEEAAAQAIEFRNSLLQGNGLTRSSNQDKAVASVYAWRSSDIAPKASTRSTASDLLPDTLLYIVNFEDSCGYALVSADALVPGVAAYVEKGTLTPDEEIENPGFKMFLEGYKKLVRDSIGKLADSLRIRGSLDSSTIARRDSTIIPELYNPYILTEYVAPLLSTKWDQTNPYNNLCPFDSNYGANCVAGCVAIAIGQVAAFYECPASYNGHDYNWEAIKEDERVDILNQEGSSSVAMLIHDIGQLVSMNYSRFESGADFDSIQYCLDAFNYHYTYNGVIENDINAIKADLLSHHPVIVSGHMDAYTGHAWVIDGLIVKKRRSSVIPEIPKYREYVHCNWGWNGGCDGYFIFKAFDKLYDTDTDKQQTGLEAYLAGIKCGFNNWIHAYHSVYPNE